MVRNKPNRGGWGRNMSAVETTTLNEIIIDTNRLTKIPSCIH